MTPHTDDGDFVLYHGDALEVLRGLPDESVDCCVTSPPYWGLRDYGHDDQIGLEETPDFYVARLVAVFRHVRRVLKSEGTCWLNLGDSYASDPAKGGSGTPNGRNGRGEDYPRGKRIERGSGRWGFGNNVAPGLKAKDLVGIPWRVAFALQQPYYAGRIKDERDLIWLAAMVEAEGCMFIHKRKAGQSNGQGYERKNATYGAGLEVSSTDRVIVERCMQVAGIGSICEQSPEQNARRKQTIYRWNVRSNECRWIVQELYPHFMAKKQEARLLLGCPSSGDEAEKAHESLKAIHQGGAPTIDFAAPESMFEPGWYLRSDVIWAKKNCMPESVTDRPTKAHEYVFLLTKSARYWYDADAISEQTNDLATKPRSFRNGDSSVTLRHDEGNIYQPRANRNARSVWEIATQAYPEAHFAVFPEELARRCIAAGCPEGGTVLDPFMGSGTTALVARKLGRKSVGIELNPDYCELAARRLGQQSLLVDV